MFVVRIHCGGYRKGIRMPNGDIEPGPIQKFNTADQAKKAGENSACVRAMGWDFTVEREV